MTTDSKSNQNNSHLEPYLQLIERIRSESWCIETEKRLHNHPYLKAAQDGSLTLSQRRAFCVQQLAIQQSDACSFAVLAGHELHRFCPNSLLSATVPEPIPQKQTHKNNLDSSNKNDKESSTICSATKTDDGNDGNSSTTSDVDLFQFLLQGEVYAANLLLQHAQSIGLESEEAIRAYAPLNPLAQAYPSYWARLALQQKRGIGAAACAVNFPAWGTMCAKLVTALTSPTATAKNKTESNTLKKDNTTGNYNCYGYKVRTEDEGNNNNDGDDDAALAFIKFFATPIDNLDIMAATIMKQENVTYEELLEPVRLLQEYEVYFWDAIYEAKA